MRTEPYGSGPFRSARQSLDRVALGVDQHFPPTHVIGLPDRRLGEIPMAWVKLNNGYVATEEEIREFCLGQIAHYKVPRYVRFVDSFPMTVTGKVQKYVLRQQMAA